MKTTEAILHSCNQIKEIADFGKFCSRCDGVPDLDGFFHYEFAVLHTPHGRQFAVRAFEILGRWNFIGLKAGRDLNMNGNAAQRGRNADGRGPLARAEEILPGIRKEPWVDQQQLTLRHAKALGCQIHVDRNAVIFGSILRGETR